ncbi:MAG: HAD hydrolase family protein [Chitinophagaceae bacterium]|nr:HAD hydrolase family protein [Chitinophagaceae bacterium]MCW5905333.1 HAD hydrolase family protein [Chitinophagaceae bacterium]
MNVLELFKPITTFVFDVDGVLTDGTLLVLPNNVMARTMNIKDGYALQLAIKKQYNVVVISGGNSPEVKERLTKLGVTDVYMQVQDKAALLTTIMQEKQLSKEQILFMGDDMPDLAAMKLVGFACCPKDAAIDIKEIVQYISPLNGGEGCARDVIEKVMKLNNNWHDDFMLRAM